jgi:hypothetical protein
MTTEVRKRRPVITEDTDDVTLETTMEVEVDNDEIKLEEEVQLEPAPAVVKPTVKKPAPAVAKPEVKKPTISKPAVAKPAPVVETIAEEVEIVEDSTDDDDTSQADADIQQTYDQESGADMMLASSECSFTANVEKFIEFLNCASFSGVMEDAFINVTKTGLKCNAAEPVSAQITSITRFDEAKVDKEGTLIISKLDKLIKVLKLFKDEITLAYKEGYITITSKDARIKILGEAESYVNSYSQLKDVVIDIENKKIGVFDFSAFPYFEMPKTAFDRIWTTISTVNLDTAAFKINMMSPVLKIEATDGRDHVDISIPIENSSITKVVNSKFSKCLKSLVSTLKGEKVSVWINEVCMIVKQGSNYYFLTVTP